MKLRFPIFQPRRNRSAVAMSLVELIGVLAVIAVLAGVLIPVAIRILDRIARQKEEATLKTLASAFEASILKTRSIPTGAGWHLFLSTNAGIDLNSITNTLRNRARVFVFDPGSAWLSANLPYVQSYAGLSAIPDLPRAMVLSSIAGNLPFTTLNASEFDGLWNSPEGTLPNWFAGNPYDVQIRRINLAPLFVNLLLSTYKPGTNGNGYFGFEATTPINAAPAGAGFSAYYLRGTELNLRTSTDLGVPASHTEILQEDESFVFENNVWQSSIIGPITAPGIGDLTGIVKAFLEAYPNPNSFYYTNTAPRTQQVLVVSTMREFMTNYSYWASQGFDAALKTTLDIEGKRDAMMDAVQGLYSQYGQFTNKPPPNMTTPPPPL